MGEFCNKSCASGTFGPDCKYNCSRHCLNDSVCNSITGKCDKGCKPGYMGEQCNNVCTMDSYGTDCMFSCSQNCLNKEPCDHVTGVCKNGCSEGYKGELCNSICGNGYFGENCSNVCSENCSDICHHIDGMCNCKAGMENSPECKQVSLLTTARECDDHCVYAIGISMLVILNVLTCTLWIRGRRRQVKVKRQSSSHYITTEAEMKVKTSESHEYQEVHSVSRDFSYQNLSFDT
ncbi:multiple epidermal growth factor-like domains protein 10 [Saccostrea cucullata]|uniref:multiple epidermal growth factor-like domains protein 10 n=1 Tax=Saccostrea cuccullata TaxID=36930 RepID=UPI002ED3EE63